MDIGGPSPTTSALSKLGKRCGRFVSRLPRWHSSRSAQLVQRFIQVLSKSVETLELSEQQAITIVENALFHNANKLYHLNLDKP